MAQLGCSSSYRCQMNTGGEGSSSKEEIMCSVSGEGDNNSVPIDEKIKKLLDKEDFKEGSPITSTEIASVVKELGRSVDMFTVDSIDKEYIGFLNKYGSINGGGFYICGPTQRTTNKVRYMSSIQRGFENRCKSNGMKALQIKSCWLIAGIDQGDEYYINLSRTNKNNIYSMSLDGRSSLFARSFSEFLDKFSEAYERKNEKEDYEKDLYKEEEDVESEEFNRMYQN
ncbi:SMI1/KNR4 family protein [Cardinium endosymbiont of Dermatophagoides farinae]|uniref:SMI1/KNR4 family protein n=1 Tax=Cardinium endosymbiont of Dermatophagoides farinae TaxID=2597823 RepID=UPI001CB91B23|nr:SMI1/KNR4 family protein [Cardinium endosymbiont of Dermatophagoides farinae]